MASQYTFNNVSSVRLARYKFDIGHKVTTTIKVGKLTPIDIMEVIPGDTWKVKTSFLARLSTEFFRPVMDAFYLNDYHFFVPLRLCYTDYATVYGNPSPSAYQNNSLGEYPSIPEYGDSVEFGTVGDYLHIAPGRNLPRGIQIMPFRAFALIYERWFRNQNTVEPMHVQLGEIADSERPNNNPWAPNNYFGQLPNVMRMKDYFSSCLPNPQKGAPVPLSTSVFPATLAPVNTGDVHYINPVSPRLSSVDGSPLGGAGVGYMSWRNNGSADFFGVDTNVQNPSNVHEVDAVFSNYWASIPQTSLLSGNVNDLRFAVQLQKMLEEDARGGSRFNEYLAIHYGVSIADSRIAFPEYLGGMQHPLNIQQVAQTSQSTQGNGLGTLGAYSQSSGYSRFTKSFDEPGYIITCVAIKYKHSYQQGIDRLYMRTQREDFYDPLFAHIGEQPVYKWQLYADVDEGEANFSLKEGSIFGYQEYAADYRYLPDKVSGQMRSDNPVHFDEWHFADNYANAPSLTSTFTDEDPTFFRRTTRISDTSEADDFLLEYYFSGFAVRTMPIKSTPGLVDHLTTK